MNADMHNRGTNDPPLTLSLSLSFLSFFLGGERTSPPPHLDPQPIFNVDFISSSHRSNRVMYREIRGD